MKKQLSLCIAAMIFFSSYAMGVTYKAIGLSGGFNESQALGNSGTQQVGYGQGSVTGNQPHAMLWNGSANSYIDLNPSGFSSSWALGTNGSQQVGNAGQHAILWNGSANDYIDLNPKGFYQTEARGICGTQQVGTGLTSTLSPIYALLWNGSATDYIVLNPSGYLAAEAYGMSGTQQVGYGYTGNRDHALLWNGSATDYVDLNPDWLQDSEAHGTNGVQQVGKGFSFSTTGGNEHALVWSGSAASCIDLHQFLPAAFTQSYANGIDIYGNIVGYAVDSSGGYHAILWQVPEPCTLLLLGLGARLCLRASPRRAAGLRKKVRKTINGNHSPQPFFC